MKQLLSTTVLLTVLSACGGGGIFGGPLPTIFTNFSSVPQNGVYISTGKAVTADYTANLTTGTVTTSGVSGPKAALVAVTNSGGFPVAESIELSGSPAASFDTRNGATVTSNGLVDTFTTADGTTAVVQINPQGAGYQYQTFGTWITGYGTSSGTVGSASFGATTPTSGVPTTGTAAYSGASIGFMKDAAGTPFFTSSTVNVSTDFTNATVMSSGTNTVNVNTAATGIAPMLDFTATGPVSGNGFAAAINNGTVSGTANGTFYGPTANEVGGTFATGGAGIAYAGSFGAN